MEAESLKERSFGRQYFSGLVRTAPILIPRKTSKVKHQRVQGCMNFLVVFGRSQFTSVSDGFCLLALTDLSLTNQPDNDANYMLPTYQTIKLKVYIKFSED